MINGALCKPMRSCLKTKGIPDPRVINSATTINKGKRTIIKKSAKNRCIPYTTVLTISQFIPRLKILNIISYKQYALLNDVKEMLMSIRLMCCAK